MNSEAAEFSKLVGGSGFNAALYQALMQQQMMNAQPVSQSEPQAYSVKSITPAYNKLDNDSTLEDFLDEADEDGIMTMSSWYSDEGFPRKLKPIPKSVEVYNRDDINVPRKIKRFFKEHPKCKNALAVPKDPEDYETNVWDEGSDDDEDIDLF